MKGSSLATVSYKGSSKSKVGRCDGCSLALFSIILSREIFRGLALGICCFDTWEDLGIPDSGGGTGGTCDLFSEDGRLTNLSSRVSPDILLLADGLLLPLPVLAPWLKEEIGAVSLSLES